MSVHRVGPGPLALTVEFYDPTNESEAERTARLRGEFWFVCGLWVLLYGVLAWVIWVVIDFGLRLIV